MLLSKKKAETATRDFIVYITEATVAPSLGGSGLSCLRDIPGMSPVLRGQAVKERTLLLSVTLPSQSRTQDTD